MTITLKKSLGEAGAFLDESNGADSNLYALLKSMAENPPEHLSARLATIATGVLTSMVITKATRLRKLSIAVAVAGSAGTTTVQVRVNGVSQGSVSVANDDADGTVAEDDLDVALEPGDVVDLNVSAAPTDGTGLTATARMNAITVE